VRTVGHTEFFNKSTVICGLLLERTFSISMKG
jgi:hypothetical protein